MARELANRTCGNCKIEFRPRGNQQLCDDCRPQCSVENCTRGAVRRGMCSGHARGTFTPTTTGHCKVEGCARTVNHLGLCSMHAFRLKKFGAVGAVEPTRKPRGGPCEVPGCDQRAKADGLCGMHYMRRKATGSVGSGGRIRVPFGEGSLNRDGYRIVSISGVKMFEHRHVMERMLGRPMTDTESVHHRDGDRANNDPANLELWGRGQPPGQRVADKVAWALALLKQYPDLLADHGYRLLALESAEATEFLKSEMPSISDVIRGFLAG